MRLSSSGVAGRYATVTPAIEKHTFKINKGADFRDKYKIID